MSRRTELMLRLLDTIDSPVTESERRRAVRSLRKMIEELDENEQAEFDNWSVTESERRRPVRRLR